MTVASSVWSDEAGPADAPVVVLVHGAMDRSSGMLKVSRRLDERYRVEEINQSELVLVYLPQNARQTLAIGVGK